MAASIHDNDLRRCCKEVMDDKEVTARYPQGMSSADILTEIRKKHGEDAFIMCSILDVHDEMTALYGRPGGR